MATRLLLLVLSVLWIAITGSGFGILRKYEATPGKQANPSLSWPADSEIRREPGRCVLVLFAHPRCPCTRATVGELAWILSRAGDRLTANVVFVKPSGATQGWEKTDLWESVSAIPNVQLLRDDNGQEARRFDAATSGQTFLYDKSGHLLFNGGITGARGHPGENPGRASVIAMIDDKKGETSKTPAFGCPLFEKACPNCKVAK